MLQLEWLRGVKENGKIRDGYWSQRKRWKVRRYSLNGCVVLRKMVRSEMEELYQYGFTGKSFEGRKVRRRLGNV